MPSDECIALLYAVPLMLPANVASQSISTLHAKLPGFTLLKLCLVAGSPADGRAQRLIICDSLNAWSLSAED
jgi:hypothetical protein